MKSTFSVHSVAVEIRGPSSKALAEPFDFYTHRPKAGGTQMKLLVAQTPRAPSPADIPPGLKARRISGGQSYQSELSRFFDFGTFVIDVRREPNGTQIHWIGRGTRAETKVGEFMRQELRRLLSRQHWHPLPAMAIGIGKTAALLFFPPGQNPTPLLMASLRREGVTFLSLDSPLLGPLGAVLPFLMPLQGEDGLVKPANLPSRWLPHPDESFRPRHLIWADFGKSGTKALLTTIPKWQAGPRLALSLTPKVRAEWEEPGAWGQVSRTAAATMLLAQSQCYLLRASRDAGETADILVEALRPRTEPAPLRLS